MKKEYHKPYLLVESFQLDAAIAATCSQDGRGYINWSVATCTLEEEEPGLGYFGASCDFNVDLIPADGNDGICYHGPVVDLAATFLNS